MQLAAGSPAGIGHDNGLKQQHGHLMGWVAAVVRYLDALLQMPYAVFLQQLQFIGHEHCEMPSDHWLCLR